MFAIHEPQKNQTPLHLAAEYGCKDSVRLLIESGSNVNARTSDVCVLLIAVEYVSKAQQYSSIIDIIYGLNALEMFDYIWLIDVSNEQRIKYHCIMHRIMDIKELSNCW